MREGGLRRATTASALGTRTIQRVLHPGGEFRRAPGLGRRSKIGFWTLFFSFSYLAAPRHIEFPGQGSDLSHSCDLHGNAGSFNPLYCTGIEPVSWHCRDATEPTATTAGTPGFGHVEFEVLLRPRGCFE